jgi:Protein of unknown function (DUF559)/Transcriptional regulator, AbiEi antitoxin
MRNLAATPDSRLARIAARQQGVVTIRQLADCGFDRWAVQRRVRAGRLHRLHRGVYAVGHTAVSLRGRWLGAVLASGKGALLSHRSAAALWGMLSTSAPKIDVIVPPKSGRRSTATIRIRRGTRDGVVHLGIPVTSPRCTLDDLAAAKIPRWQLRKAEEVAQRLGEPVTPQGPRSALEEAFLALCPTPPVVNGIVEGFEVDFHWPEQRLVVETDGHEHHGTRAPFERDRARDQALTAAGWTVVRFTYRQVLEEPVRVRDVLLSVRSRSLVTP